MTIDGIVAQRRARQIEKFRRDPKFQSVIREVERNGLEIEPIWHINKGYVSGYRRSRVSIEGCRCGIYLLTHIHRTAECPHWTSFVLENQLRELDMTLFVLVGQSKLRFLPVPPQPILRAHPGRRINVHVPLAGYEYKWNSPGLDYLQFEDQWNQFVLLRDRKTAPAVPVNPVSSSPA